MVQIEIDHARIVAFCRKWQVAEFSLFGSVLRDDFRPDSDVDVMVVFEPGHVPGLAFFTMERELSELFGRKVDLVTRRSVERSENHIRRRHILSHREIVHAGR